MLPLLSFKVEKRKHVLFQESVDTKTTIQKVIYIYTCIPNDAEARNH